MARVGSAPALTAYNRHEHEHVAFFKCIATIENSEDLSSLVPKEERNKYHYSCDMAFESPLSEAVYFQILTLVDGIEDEDWDVQYVLHEITRILELGWNVNDKYRTPTNGGSVLL